MNIRNFKKYIVAILSIFVLLSVTACGNNENIKENKNKSNNSAKENLNEKKNNESNNEKDSKDKSEEVPTFELKYASGFHIEYLGNGIKKVIDGENRTLILVPKEIDVPVEYKDEIVIRTPIESIFLASTTQACAVKAIDEVDSIVAVTTDESQWEIPAIKEGIQNGNIKYIGGSEGIDYEMLATLNPDLAVVYTGDYGQFDIIAKLEELGINYVVDNEYTENTAFGRMEWNKLLGAFYNKEELAAEHLDKAIEKVEEAKKKVEGKEKPKVVWANVYGGTVYVPGEDTYVAEMIKMAGGESVFEGYDVGGGQISIEQLYEKAQDADVFIYSSMQTYTPDINTIIELAPVVKDLQVIKDKNVWVFHPDFYQSLDKTDELIIDLMEIFHEGSTGEKVRHYIKLQ